MGYLRHRRKAFRSGTVSGWTKNGNILGPKNGNLVGYFPFQNSIIDLTGNCDFTNPGGELAYVDAKYGKGFNPTSGTYLYLPVATFDYAAIWAAGVFTIRVYFKTSRTSVNQIFLDDDSQGSGIEIRTQNDSDRCRAQLFTAAGAQVASAVSDSSYADDTLHSLVVRADGAALALFVDGAMEDSSAMSGTIGDSGNDLRLGKRSDNDWYFEGVFDELAIWDTNLSNDEITALEDAFYLGE